MAEPRRGHAVRSGMACAGLMLALAACGEPTGGPVASTAAPLWVGADAAGKPDIPLDLRVAVDPREVALLDPVVVTVDLFVGADLEVAFEPAVPAAFDGKFVAKPEAEWGDPQGTWRRWVGELRPVEVGEVEFSGLSAEGFAPGAVDTTAETPPEPVARAATAPVVLRVASALATADIEDDGADVVEPPAPPFVAPFRWVFWGLVVAGLALILGAVWWWRRGRTARQFRSSDGIPLPPHAKALRALAALRDAPRTTPAQVEAFYVEVSAILRVYLEDRFGLRAPERTTEEFLPEVERSGLLAVEQRVPLRRFLEQCDLVKFAAVRPGEATHVETFTFAEELVESTRPDRDAVGADVGPSGGSAAKQEVSAS